MSEKIKVWVKTDLLDKLVFGKTHSSSIRRMIPDASNMESSDDDSDNELCNWGWAMGELLSESSEELMSDGIDTSKPSKVYINDVESEHNRTSVEIPAAAVSEGGMVMANQHDDDEDEMLNEYGEVDPNAPCPYPDDLIGLTHLHEPAVVYCLRKRYTLDKIYTATGPILLALNPFKQCKNLYSTAMLKRYCRRGEQSTMMVSSQEEKKSEGMEDDEYLGPHVYAVADNSYRIMMTKLEEAASASSGRRRAPKVEVHCNQSILVSGESGAGKTVTTKYVMSYLASLSQQGNVKRSHTISSDKKSVEQQVLQSNPILESFGNARTIRNDNSSRFGKFIEIQFTSSGSLVGASIETYLLEKVRLVIQAPGERNYHIFYEMLAGFSDEERSKFFIEDYTCEDFNMTNSSGTYDRRDGVDDFDTYGDLLEAMETMGFSEEERDNILTITAACLHFGNCEVVALSADESKIDPENEHIDAVLNLLGVTWDQLNRAICYFSIKAGRETHVRSLQKAKAERGIMGLIKTIYGALFDYIVKQVNSCITVDAAPGRGTSASAASIGVLDIFGFESFKVNSFEQLCINYCNETLQQQFNLFVLKNEQDEYEKEGIKWSFISFPENQDVIDLIDKKGMGILKILDDQCRAPGTTDKTFANDIYQKCSGHPRFQANFRQVGALKFGVVHYAGAVEYDTEGFVEKNKDEVPRETTDLLLNSENAFVKNIAKIMGGGEEEAPKSPPGRRAPPSRSRAKNKKTTVGLQFSSQLQSLRKKIDSTSPHYIRCLKPNDILIPDNFDPIIIADQLRCAGVVEAVRVSRIGYPQRYTHALFLQRYKVLALADLKKAVKLRGKQKPVDVLVGSIAQQIYYLENPSAKPPPQKKGRATSKQTEPAVDLVEVGMQVGKTKVFLRRKAYDILERLRKRKMAECAMVIQTAARRYVGVMLYRICRTGFIQLQAEQRRIMATEKTQRLRENKASIKIQTAYRRYVDRKRYLAVYKVCRQLQNRHRGIVARAEYHHLLTIQKQIIIAKYYRRFILSKKYTTKKLSAQILQRAYRCYVAKKTLKELKAKAKNLAAVGEERNRLKAEKQALLEKLEEAKRLAKIEAEKAAAAAVANASVVDSKEYKRLESDLEVTRDEMDSIKIQLENETMRADKAELVADNIQHELEELKQEVEQLKTDLQEEKADASTKMEEKDSELTKLKLLCEQLKNDLRSQKDAHETTLTKQEEILTELEKSQKANNVLKEDLQKARDMAAQAQAETAAAHAMEEESIEESLAEAQLEELEELRQENDMLKTQLEDAKQEAFFGANDTREQLQEALEEIEGLKSALEEASSSPAPAEDKGGNKDASLVLELDKAKREIQDLRLELEYVKTKAKESNKPNHSAELDLSVSSSLNGAEFDELIQEITRLKRELNTAQKTLEEERKSREEEQSQMNSSMNLNSRYEELVRLAGACMDKDREIHNLRQEIESLQKDLTLAKQMAQREKAMHHEHDEQSYGSLSSNDDSGNGFWSSLFKKDGQHTQTRLKEYRNEEVMSVEDASALKSVNEMLRKELESACAELNETKRKHAEEVQRSTKDMEAFAEALKGVDELRTAAEMMSRELTRMKKQKRQSRTQRMNYEDYDDQSVVSIATQQLEDANRAIDYHKKSEQTNPIWGKIKKQANRSKRNLEEELDVDEYGDGMDDIPRSFAIGRKSSSGRNSRRSHLQAVDEDHRMY